MVNLGTANYKVRKGYKIAQLIVERIISDEAILVQDLEATTRGTKGFGSSDKGVTKQDGTAPDCLVNIPEKLQDDQTPKAAAINIQKKTESSLNQNLRKLCQETPRAQTMTKQVSAVPDCLVSHLQKIPGPRNQTEGHNTPNGTSEGRIYISEITHREFHKAYKNGETTGVVKFTQKKSQIYL